MSKFSIFQQNNLIIGTHLAAELSSSSPELRSFIIIGSFAQTSRGASKPSHVLNEDHEDLRFWLHKYEIDKSYIGSKNEVVIEQLVNNVSERNIQSVEQLEKEVEKYLQDFSLLKTVSQFNPRLPFS